MMLWMKAIFWVGLFIYTGVRGAPILLVHAPARFNDGFMFCVAGDRVFGNKSKSVIGELMGEDE